MKLSILFMENFGLGTRSIIQQGGSLYMALPPAWLKAHGLKAADTVKAVMDKDFNLKIVPFVAILGAWLSSSAVASAMVVIQH
jgi:hypothetical protein